MRIKNIEITAKNLSNAPGEFIDWLDNVIEHLSSPIFSLLGTLAPFLAPIAVAQFVSAGLVSHGLMTKSEAYWFTIVLEMIGIVAFSEYAATGISMRQRTKKGRLSVSQGKKRHSLMGWVCAGYLFFLATSTVVLAWGSPWYEMAVRISLLGVPVMAGTIYGYMRVKNSAKYAANNRKITAEKRRQEKREDKAKEQAIALKALEAYREVVPAVSSVKSNVVSEEKLSYAELSDEWKKLLLGKSTKDITGMFPATDERTARNWRKFAERDFNFPVTTR